MDAARIAPLRSPPQADAAVQAVVQAAPLASAQFARHALTTRYEDLSPDAIGQAKVFILDTIGVGIAGSTASGAAEIVATASGWGASDEATLSSVPLPGGQGNVSFSRANPTPI